MHLLLALVSLSAVLPAHGGYVKTVAARCRNPCVQQGTACLPIEPMQPGVPPQKDKQRMWRHWKARADDIIYKPSLVDIDAFPRKFYLDVGANTYNSAIGGWFRPAYPRGREFKVVAFEVNPVFYHDYSLHPEVEYIQMAAWISNTTLRFSGYGEAGNVMGKLVMRKGKSLPVPAIDLAGFILSRYRPEDFLVVKLDVEGAEYPIVEHLISTSAIRLIDELFVEWHCREVHGPELVDVPRSASVALMSRLRSLGVYAHEWV